MTDLIERAKAALEGATPGPWEVKYTRGTTQLQTPSEITMCDETYYPWTPDNDADWHLIALAPDLARLAVAAGELAKELDTLHDAEFSGSLRRALARFRAIAEGKE